jgi:hypothetical protein
VESGDIYRHDRFYRDLISSELKRKYLVFLAPTPSGDWVARLLTSQANLRGENPPCSLQPPYPGFFLGLIGGPLPLKTWVDLRALPDIDLLDVGRGIGSGIMAKVAELPANRLKPLIACAAAAEDTTSQQERALRDQLTRMT